MKSCQLTKIVMLTVISFLMVVSGCDLEKKDNSIAEEMERSRAKIESGQTIGSLAQVYAPDAIAVRGYAIVGGLRGTGSSECPPQIRDYLTQYILRYLPDKDVNKFINSKDTSVVIVEGLMPTSPVRGQRFDVRVAAPDATQTTSIEGGRLYGAELRAAGTFGVMTKVLAYAEGPVYIDKIDGISDEKIGYVLNGGVVLDDYKIVLSLREPDYLVANTIRNKLIERFGDGVANALSAGQVEIKIPSQYVSRKQQFVSIVKSTYLNLTGQKKEQKIKELISQLAGSNEKDVAEAVLEAIGKDSLKPLKKLLDLNSVDEEVRFRAARCLLNLGSDEGFSILREIALDDNSSYRMAALEAVSMSARQSDIEGLCRRLLRDGDTKMKIAVYERLRQLDDIAITAENIAGDFSFEQIALTRDRMIFVSRSGQPRIAVFGGPIYCSKNIFIQSPDGYITINGLPEQNFITIIRHIPGKPEIPPISLQCSYELGNIIRTLGLEPTRKKEGTMVGLGISYSQIIELLKKMVEQGAVDAEFYAGSMPQISLK
ncbi:MAG: flagellar basal body P-ring protein FlgI [Sedimentisphaerales bacterium]|nr:flagellar basal body P-ring protein FlgI [Sedimentisphaerales bacterium]